MYVWSLKQKGNIEDKNINITKQGVTNQQIWIRMEDNPNKPFSIHQPRPQNEGINGQ